MASVVLGPASAGAVSAHHSSVPVPVIAAEDTASTDRADQQEGEKLAGVSVMLETAATQVRGTPALAQLGPSILVGQLGAVIPSDVLSPVVATYFDLLDAYRSVAGAAADGLDGFSEATAPVGPLVNPAIRAGGATALGVVQAGGASASDMLRAAGHENSLIPSGLEHLGSVARAFGLTAESDP